MELEIIFENKDTKRQVNVTDESENFLEYYYMDDDTKENIEQLKIEFDLQFTSISNNWNEYQAAGKKLFEGVLNEIE